MAGSTKSSMDQSTFEGSILRLFDSVGSGHASPQNCAVDHHLNPNKMDPFLDPEQLSDNASHRVMIPEVVEHGGV